MRQNYKLEDYVTQELLEILDYMYAPTEVTPSSEWNKVLYKAGERSVVNRIREAVNKAYKTRTLAEPII